jgi:hypothetical protein
MASQQLLIALEGEVMHFKERILKQVEDAIKADVQAAWDAKDGTPGSRSKSDCYGTLAVNMRAAATRLNMLAQSIDRLRDGGKCPVCSDPDEVPFTHSGEQWECPRCGKIHG